MITASSLLGYDSTSLVQPVFGEFLPFFSADPLKTSQLGEKRPCEVLVCHMHEPVLVGHMHEPNVNDELIMNDEKSNSCKYNMSCVSSI